MLEKTLRTPYQYLFVNWAASYLKDKIHPISVTCFSIIFGIISAICISFNFSMIAIILLLLSGYCDTLDGTIARMAKKQSDIGSVLDIMADRVVEISIILGLYFYSNTFFI